MGTIVRKNLTHPLLSPPLEGEEAKASFNCDIMTLG
jgi:hypothetical protein